jgi:XTP/dITP diphosphohydrolase
MTRARREPRVVVATENEGKLREIRAILEAAGSNAGFELCSLDGLPPVDFPEEGADYQANAIAKARAAADQLGVVAVADDSGIEVDALDGAPGALSARYGGPDLDDAGRLQKLLDAILDVGDDARSARFVCTAALALPRGETRTARGVCEGKLLHAPRGETGFGYDPIFQPRGQGGLSMAELSSARKNVISHRAQAFVALARGAGWLRP